MTVGGAAFSAVLPLDSLDLEWSFCAPVLPGEKSTFSPPLVIREPVLPIQAEREKGALELISYSGAFMLPLCRCKPTISSISRLTQLDARIGGGLLGTGDSFPAPKEELPRSR